MDAKNEERYFTTVFIIHPLFLLLLSFTIIYFGLLKDLKVDPRLWQQTKLLKQITTILLLHLLELTSSMFVMLFYILFHHHVFVCAEFSSSFFPSLVFTNIVFRILYEEILYAYYVYFQYCLLMNFNDSHIVYNIVYDKNTSAVYFKRSNKVLGFFSFLVGPSRRTWVAANILSFNRCCKQDKFRMQLKIPRNECKAYSGLFFDHGSSDMEFLRWAGFSLGFVSGLKLNLFGLHVEFAVLFIHFLLHRLQTNLSYIFWIQANQFRLNLFKKWFHFGFTSLRLCLIGIHFVGIEVRITSTCYNLIKPFIFRTNQTSR